VPSVGWFSTSAPAAQWSLGYGLVNRRDRLDFTEPPTELKELPDRPQLAEQRPVVTGRPERRQRYMSAAEMHADLLLINRGRSVREKRSNERRLRWSVAAGIGLVVLTMGTLGIVWGRSGEIITFAVYPPRRSSIRWRNSSSAVEVSPTVCATSSRSSSR
jgi:hypothetical protein